MTGRLDGRLDLPRVLLLTDRTQLPPGRDLVETLAACATAWAAARADAGPDLVVVVRELDLPEERRAALVRQVAATGARVVAARTWHPPAVAVHLGATQTGLDARPAPAHGRSCHRDEEVRRAVGGGAAYVTVSPVAPSASKPGYGPALGPDGVRRAVRLAEGVPVFALGGVDAGNAAAMRAAGAHGVAVMGAVMRADDPAAALAAIAEAAR